MTGYSHERSARARATGFPRTESPSALSSCTQRYGGSRRGIPSLFHSRYGLPPGATNTLGSMEPLCSGWHTIGP